MFFSLENYMYSMYLVILQTLKYLLRCKDMDVFADISRHLSYKWVFVHTMVFNEHVYERPLMFLCLWTDIYLSVNKHRCFVSMYISCCICIYVWTLKYFCMRIEVFVHWSIDVYISICTLVFVLIGVLTYNGQYMN